MDDLGILILHLFFALFAGADCYRAVDPCAANGDTTRPECKGWPTWKPHSCEYCNVGSHHIPIQSLQDNNGPPGALGCDVASDRDETPECDIEEKDAIQQVGGHVGTFYTLRGGAYVAKRMKAFDFKNCGGTCNSKQNASRTEWNFYMQTWCLQKLQAKGYTNVASDLLAPFALGESPWAPRFHGACRITKTNGKHKIFLMVENLLAGYRKPTQLDLKVGFTMEPNLTGVRNFAKGMFQDVVGYVKGTSTTCARAVGNRVWDPKQQQYSAVSTYGKLEVVLGNVFGGVDWNTIQDFLFQLQGIARWWHQTGNLNVRSYAASLFFIFESDSANANFTSKPPIVKIIDFAHFHALSDHPTWPDDCTSTGITSAISALTTWAFEQ